MDKKITLIIFLTIFFGLFFTIGLSLLQNTKEKIENSKITGLAIANNSSDGPKVRTIDLRDDPLCYDYAFDEIKLECLTFAGCEHVCRNRGCLSYNMKYDSTDFSERICKCRCSEESIILY
jgi:hypothetical protein